MAAMRRVELMGGPFDRLERRVETLKAREGE